MKKVTLFLFAISLLPTSVLVWNTQEENFSGALKLESPVLWVWKVGQGNEILKIQQHCSIRRGDTGEPYISINLAAGRTILTMPTKCERLSSRVSY